MKVLMCIVQYSNFFEAVSPNSKINDPVFFAYTECSFSWMFQRGDVVL